MGPSRLLLLLLLLPPLPLVSSAPVDCSSAQGATEKCKCEISSDLTLKATGAPDSGTVKWFHGSTEIKDGGRYGVTASATEHSLKIESVADSDAGEYTASYSGNTHTFTVQPLVVCEVSTASGTCTVDQGKNVRLKSGQPSGVTWIFDESAVPEWGTSVNGDLDIIDLVKGTHEGTYEAKDSTTPTTIHKTITLSITVPQIPQPGGGKDLAKSNDGKPGQAGRLVEVKASGIPKTGTELTLDCVVTDNGAPAAGVSTFVWLKNGNVMVDNTGATVVFKALKKMDAGTYACKVGTDQSSGYDLRLTGGRRGGILLAYSPALLLTLSLLDALLYLLCY
ncbi:uncharacterized protein ACBT44_017012 [Syngnathus typhle]